MLAVELRHDERVLDVACGPGTTPLAPRVAEVVAVDVTEAMLATRRGWLRSRGRQCPHFSRETPRYCRLRTPASIW